jgi:hypothetical protein
MQRRFTIREGLEEKNVILESIDEGFKLSSTGCLAH